VGGHRRKETMFDLWDVLRTLVLALWLGYCGICLGGAWGFVYAKRHPAPTWKPPRDKGNTMEVMYGDRHLKSWIFFGSRLGAVLGPLCAVPLSYICGGWSERAYSLVMVVGLIIGAVSVPALALPNPYNTYVEPAFRLMVSPIGKCAEECNDLIFGQRVLKESPWWGGTVGATVALFSRMLCEPKLLALLLGTTTPAPN